MLLHLSCQLAVLIFCLVGVTMFTVGPVMAQAGQQVTPNVMLAPDKPVEPEVGGNAELVKDIDTGTIPATESKVENDVEAVITDVGSRHVSEDYIMMPKLTGAPHSSVTLSANWDSLEDSALVAVLQNYLDSLRSMDASFVQTTPQGDVLTGLFFLKRPGRLRFQYNESEDYIVADGGLIYYWDATARQQSNAPIGSTLADFLLRDSISLTEDIAVSEVIRADKSIATTLQLAKESEDGSLTLIFDTDPLILRAWRVVDSEGMITDLLLDNIRTGRDMPRSLFRAPPRGD